jgi:hypothetical protein
MPLRITPASFSGIKKKKPSRSRASPFASHARTKPSARSSSSLGKEAADDLDDDAAFLSDSLEPLSDNGPWREPTATKIEGVVQAMRHITESMFDELPAARAGMNSTRIAEVLNLRRSLPPLVSVAHIHTVLQAPTQVEREIVSLLRAGQLRRLIVPGRGNDAAGLGDCLILADDLNALVGDSADLEQQLKGIFGCSTPHKTSADYG